MENVLELKGLMMPSCYVSIDDEEMEYVDGEGFWKVFTGVCTIVAGVGTVVGGIIALCVPEPTGLTKAGGITAICVGVATVGAGIGTIAG